MCAHRKTKEENVSGTTHEALGHKGEKCGFQFFWQIC